MQVFEDEHERSLAGKALDQLPPGRKDLIPVSALEVLFGGNGHGDQVGRAVIDQRPEGFPQLLAV